MSVVRIKINICEYYFEYETLEDIKKHFRKNDTRCVGLDTLENYDGNTRGEKVLLRDLTLEHIKWAKENCKWGSRYLRGWKN